jgi:serine phosphatase RsbU (regulator of sigma subunit)
MCCSLTKTGGCLVSFPPRLCSKSTDGIEEATDNADVEFGVPGLAGVLQANLDRPAGEVLDELLAEVSRFTGGAPFADDICLVAAELPL